MEEQTESGASRQHMTVMLQEMLRGVHMIVFDPYENYGESRKEGPLDADIPAEVRI